MLSDHAIKLLEERYLLKDEDGNIIETPDEFFVRVAKHGAKTDEEFQDNLEAISSFKFVPSRTPYMGTERPFCSSCFVLGPIEDDTDSILDVLKQNVAVQRYGGGAGFNFSRLRPQGDVIKKTKGKASGPVSFMQLYDSAMRVFLRAGNKMGAQMAVLNVDHPDIEKFITCKDKEGELTTFNISVAVSDSFMQAVNEDRDWDLVFGGKVYKTIRAKDLWRKLTYQSWKNGEPGIIFIDTVNRFNKYPVKIEASNPCFHGDTLVAVADGRNFVKIKDLAQEGKDVPVYSYNVENGETEIKWGRNPRKTGENKKLLRVYLDDDSFLDVTENHKFILVNGQEVEARDLKPGDGVPRFTKEQDVVKEEGKKLYWRIRTNSNPKLNRRTFEHRLIYKFFNEQEWESLYGTCKRDSWASGGIVVHHRDYDGLNNSPGNLEIMTWEDHNRFHAGHDFSGNRNPMFGKSHSEETKRKIGEKTKQRISDKSYRDRWEKELKLSQTNEWRENLSSGKLKYHLQRKLAEAKKWGLDVFVDQKTNKLMVNKVCEISGIRFVVPWEKREVCYAPGQLRNRPENKEKIREKRNALLQKKAKENLHLQIQVYRDLFSRLGRVPLKKEWERECKKRKVTYRFSTKTSNPYILSGYRELKKVEKEYNHRVVRVEVLDGLHAVYNITVEDNHTVGIITKNKMQRNGVKQSLTGIYTFQCGEQFLPPSASCNLGSINLSKFVTDGVFDWEQFERYVRIGVRFLDTSLERAWWPLDGVRETTLKYKNIGLGIMGFADALIQMQIPYDSDRAVLFANNVGEFLITVARDESDKMGSNNTTLTTIAPTGSIATLAGCSYGIEPIFAVSFTKNTLLGSVTQLNEQFIEIAKRRGFYTEELVAKIEKSGSIQDIPEVPQDVKDVFKTAGEISVDRHVEIQAAFQKHVCNAISKTINLHNSATVEEVGRVYMLAYNSGCKSTTVYRDGSRVIQAMDTGKYKKKEQKWELYISDPSCISGTCSI